MAALHLLVERWLGEQQYAATTRTTYRETLDALERRFPVRANRVTEAMLIDFLTTDPDGERTRRSPGTLNRQRSTLRAFFRWAHRRGLLKHDPSLRLEEVNLGRGDVRMGRWLSNEEALQLVAVCRDGSDQGLRDEALLITALLTGLRRSELSSLVWNQVDLRLGQIKVHGKGNKTAIVGIPDQAHTLLKRWLLRTQELRRCRSVLNDPVFPSGHQQGGINNSAIDYSFHWQKPLSKWGCYEVVVRRAQDVCLGTVSTHDLRRTFAGLLDEQGVDLKGIQAALRHASPAVTASCYLDRSPRRALEAVKGLRL